MHTIEAFHRYDSSIGIILVLPADFIEAWKKLCAEYDFTLTHEIKAGGRHRFESVKEGITGIPDECLVAVHDGVRPLVSISTIDRCFEKALESGNAVPCIEIPETLRKIESQKNIQVDRRHFRFIQTPQVFKGSVLKTAYRQTYREKYTDDAGVVEDLGYSINLVEGNAENMKITHPHDLILAEAIAEKERLI